MVRTKHIKRNAVIFSISGVLLVILGLIIQDGSVKFISIIFGLGFIFMAMANSFAYFLRWITKKI